MRAVQQLTGLRRSRFGDGRLLILSLATLLWLICTQHNLCSFHFSPGTASPGLSHCASVADEKPYPSTDPLQDCHDTPCLAAVGTDSQAFENLNLSSLSHASVSLEVLPWLLGWLLALAVSLPRAPPAYRRSPRQVVLYGYRVLRN